MFQINKKQIYHITLAGLLLISTVHNGSVVVNAEIKISDKMNGETTDEQSVVPTSETEQNLNNESTLEIDTVQGQTSNEEQSIQQTQPLNGQARTITHTGTMGTVDWTFDSEFTLTFYAGTLPDESPFINANWLDQLINYKIKKVVFAGTVVAGESISGMFQNFHALSDIVNMSNFDTSNTTDMSYMFARLPQSIALDLSELNTSNVTNMSNMFAFSMGITDVDMSTWDTSKVTDMSYMFSACHGLTDVDLSHLDTSSVTTMVGMFRFCTNLTSLNLSTWNTSNVTNIESMFYYCRSLPTIDINQWDVSKVTSLTSVFGYCSELQTIDLTNWDVSSVTSMTQLFEACSSLQTLDLNTWNTSSVTSLHLTFMGCSMLTELNIDRWDISSVERMNYTFSGCTSLTDFNISQWDTSKTQTMIRVFGDCKSLKTLDLSNWNLSSEFRDNAQMFAGAYIEEIIVGPNFRIASATELNVPTSNDVYTGQWEYVPTKTLLTQAELHTQAGVIPGKYVWKKRDLNPVIVPNPIVKPDLDLGRTCQDDEYPAGYYWNGTACVLASGYVVPNTGVQ